MTSIAERLVLIVMVVTYSFSVASAQQSFTKSLQQENYPSLKHLTDVTNSANQNLHQTPPHKLVRRQTTQSDESTFTPENEAFCFAQLNAVLCSTGTVQGFIDAGLSCNRDNGIEQAQIDANACARNERGQYCLSALSLFELAGVRYREIIGNCSRVLTSNSCPTACRNQLENFRSTLGCCINAYINGSMTIGYRTILDYRLWNLCDVPLPAEGCGNGPIVNRPVNVQDCTDEEYFNKQFTQNFCLPQRGQPYINAIVLSSRCNQSLYSTAELLVDACSEDANGSPCGLLTSDIIDDLNSDCTTSNVGCTSNCRDSINDVKDMYGCCLNSASFNMSTDSPPGLSYSVWKSCEIQTPGFCESSLSLRGTAATIMKESHVAIILTMTIAGLMCHYMQDTIII
jgi:hypothetical protein